MKFLEKILSWGLYLLAFLLPLQTRLFIRPGELNVGYFEYGTISVYGTDILLMLLLILFVFTPSPGQERVGVRLVARCKDIIDRLFARFSGRNSTSSCPSPGQEKGLCDKTLSIKRNLFCLIIALNLAALVSIFFAEDKLVASQVYARLTLGMGLFFLVSQAVYDQAKLLYAFLAGASLQAAMGIWQFLSQSTFASKWLGLAAHPAAVGGNSVIETLAGGRWLRAYGGLDHPNMLGGLMAVAIIILLSLRVTERSEAISGSEQLTRDCHVVAGAPPRNNKKGKLIALTITFYFLFFMYLTALFFTFSRGAWLGLAAGLAIILAVSIYRRNGPAIKNLFIFSAASAALLGILIFTYHDLVTTRLSGTARLEIKSNQERTASYHDAVGIIKNNWLTGVGIGSYTANLTRLYPTEPAWFYQPAHNVFLLVWAELGTIGLILFICLIWALLISNDELLISNKNSNGQLPGVLNKKFNHWKLIRNSTLVIRNWISAERNYYKLPIIVTLFVIMQVDHYPWSLHFGILFFWFLLGLAARDGKLTDLTKAP
jgi:O-antigen ligase